MKLIIKQKEINNDNIIGCFAGTCKLREMDLQPTWKVQTLEVVFVHLSKFCLSIVGLFSFFAHFVPSKALNGERASHFTNGGFPTSAEKNVMNIRTFFECYSGGEKKKTENDFSQQCVL